MISLEEALDRVLAQVSPLDKEWFSLSECLGMVLAQDIYSTINIPPWDNSAMDGYALRFEDTLGATAESPKVLKVIGEARAGSVFRGKVLPGTAVRIMTGAPVPEGADAVVQFENTDESQRKDLSFIAILKEASPQLNIRKAGEDIKKGALVFSEGTEIGPAQLGVLASLGIEKVLCYRRPVVAILATGDELQEPGTPLSPGKIYNSNTYSLLGQVKEAGGIPLVLGIAQDNASELKEKIEQALSADLFLSSGGVSRGDYDLVKKVLAEEGEISFHIVRTKPGKPLAFGIFRRGDRKVPHLGLPGNPVSSMVTFELYARPSILKMRGKKNLFRPRVKAILEDEVKKKDERRHFLRVKVEKRGNKYYARLTGPQGSGILTSMAYGNGLAIIPEEKRMVKAGEEVEVILLDRSEEAV